MEQYVTQEQLNRVLKRQTAEIIGLIQDFKDHVDMRFDALEKAVTKNTVDIAHNTEVIAGITAVVEANTEMIATNTDTIVSNTEAIAVNTSTLSAQAEAIADNATAIGGNTAAVNDLSRRVTRLEDAVAGVDGRLQAVENDVIEIYDMLKPTKQLQGWSLKLKSKSETQKTTHIDAATRISWSADIRETPSIWYQIPLSIQVAFDPS